jgi:flagellar protein FlaG
MSVSSVTSAYASAAQSYTAAPNYVSSSASPANQSVLAQAVQAVNNSDLLGPENELTFVVDRAAHMVVIRLVNKDTREMIEQIPAQDVVRIAEELNGTSNGITA